MLVRLIRLAACAAAVATLVIMVLVGDLSSPELIGIFVAFAVIVNAPHILAWFIAGRLGGSRAGLVIFGAVFAVVAGLGLYGYWYIFFAERQTDAQDAIVFAVFPLYQTGAVLLAWGLGAVIAKWQERSQRR